MKRLKVIVKFGEGKTEGYVEGTGNGFATIYFPGLGKLLSIGVERIEALGYEEV